jgi:hemerythrin
LATEIIWDSAFSVGNTEIDVQHKALFALASSLESDLDQDQIRLVILELHRFMMHHFESEENFMEEMAYPDIDEHKQQHNQLVNKLKQLDQLDLMSDGPILALRKFLREWLSDHILYEDMRYANYFRNTKGDD